MVRSHISGELGTFLHNFEGDFSWSSQESIFSWLSPKRELFQRKFGEQLNLNIEQARKCMYSLPTPLFSWIFTPYMEPLAYISDGIRVAVGVVVVVIRSTYALVKIENRSRKLSYVINSTESESEDSERFHFFQFRLRLRRLWSSENCPKIPKINSRAYLFQRPFSRSLYSEGLIYGGKFAFPNRLGSPYL